MKMTIKNRIMILGFTTVLLVVVMQGGFSAWRTIVVENAEMEHYAEEAMQTKKQSLKDMVAITFSALKQAFNEANDKQRLRLLAEGQLKSSLETVYAYIEERHKQALGQADPEAAMQAAQEEAKQFIQNMRFGANNDGYVWVHSFPERWNKPHMVLEPVQPNLNGKKLAYFLYPDGPQKGEVVYATEAAMATPVFIHMNRIVKTKGEGFVSFDWPKPDASGENVYQTKLSYVRLFEPWGWVLGTGAYMSNLETQVKQDMMRMIAEFRFGPNNDHYFWIHTFDPNAPDTPILLMDPSMPDLQGMPLTDYRFPFGDKKGERAEIERRGSRQPLFVGMNQMIQESESGFLQFEWPRLVSVGVVKQEMRLGYLQLFKEWNWVVGTAVFLNDIEAMKAEKQASVQQKIQELLWSILLISIIGILISYFLILLLSQGIVKPILRISLCVQQLGENNLTTHMTEADLALRDELGDMARGYESALHNIKKIIGHIRSEVENVVTASQTFSAGNQKLADRTEKQASALEETSAAIEELTATVQQNADNANQAYKISKEAKNVADAADTQLQETVTHTKSDNQAIVAEIKGANKRFFDRVRSTSKDTLGVMQGISESSKKISGITSVINDIAFQTNLLAINAAIEAARAGEHGRGFAVVATEVRKLASRSAKASKEIGSLIHNNIEQILSGVQTADQAGQSLAELQQEISEKLGSIEEALATSLDGLGERVTFNLADITESVTKVADMVENISAASMEQAEGIRQVSIAVTEMEKITHQNASLAEEAVVTSRTLVGQAEQLMGDVYHFKLEDDGAFGTFDTPEAQDPQEEASHTETTEEEPQEAIPEEQAHHTKPRATASWQEAKPDFE